MNPFTTPSTPRGRPSWSGLLRLNLVALPVKAYPAVSTRDTPHANLLHGHCGQRIHLQKRCPVHGDVPNEDIVKGYPCGNDQYLMVEPEELEKLRPPRDRALVLEQFVPLAQIDPVRFAGRSLYLWPDGPAALPPYAVLTQGLAQAGKAALSRVVLSGTRQLALVRPRGAVLVLDLLHFPAQVKDVASWEGELGQAAPVAPAELELARRLIDMASTPLDWSRFRDSSAEDLAALLQAKLALKPPVLSEEEPGVLNLLEALQKSVAAAQKDSEPDKPRPRARRRTG